MPIATRLSQLSLLLCSMPCFLQIVLAMALGNQPASREDQEYGNVTNWYERSERSEEITAG